MRQPESRRRPAGVADEIRERSPPLRRPRRSPRLLPAPPEDERVAAFERDTRLPFFASPMSSSLIFSWGMCARSLACRRTRPQRTWESARRSLSRRARSRRMKSARADELRRRTVSSRDRRDRAHEKDPTADMTSSCRTASITESSRSAMNGMIDRVPSAKKRTDGHAAVDVAMYSDRGIAASCSPNRWQGHALAQCGLLDGPWVIDGAASRIFCCGKDFESSRLPVRAAGTISSR